MVLRVVGVPLAGASPLLEAIEGALGGEDRGGGQEGRLELEHLVLHQRQLHQVVRQALQLPLKKKKILTGLTIDSSMKFLDLKKKKEGPCNFSEFQNCVPSYQIQQP